MKVIIAGSRDITGLDPVRDAINGSGFEITEVVSGGARGPDQTGEVLARFMGWSLKIFRADWDKHGKSAGPIRNREMAKYADALIAVFDGQSRGTKNMTEEMTKLGKPVYIHLVNKEDFKDKQ